MIAEIIPEKRTAPDKNIFSYIVPENLQSQIRIGSIVEIPFGKNNIRGVILRIQNTDNRIRVDYELKEIKSINPDFSVPKQYLDIAKWISKYYLCSLGEAISLFLPPIISRPRTQSANHESRITNHEIRLTSEQEEIFQKLKDKLAHCSIRQPAERTKNDGSSRLTALDNKPALIHGVTGSGKTEIYLKLAKEAIKINKQVVVLVPEIMLTPQTVEKFEQIFPDQACLLHSGLSKSEKYLNYKQFTVGDKKIIIGPRSALLVPNVNIGLIIIDEEQEDAYKQEKDPRYHAVDLAEKIADRLGALLVLGTATPRIETYYKAKKEIFDLFELKSRYQKLILPPARIIDLKNEIKHDNFSPISLELQKNIAEVLKNKRHAILFLNRRGMATFVSCRECGEIINCPRCNIPMVYHTNYDKHILNCHHCDYKVPVPSICPVCKSSRIKFFGAGVDKIELEIKRLFPKARIRKIDSKSLQNKGEYMKLYDDLQKGKIDILIGTQILAKGLDIGTVDLVGVISADVGLHLPHFKASEKTFSLLTQVSGRSGRKDNVGRTIIQTYWPNSSAIQFAADHNYKDFYKEEIKEREKFNYPPFCYLIRVISEDKNKQKACDNIFAVAQKLSQNEIDHIGPGPCFLNKINNKFRYHIIIKTNILPNPKITEIFKINPYLIWDTDPVDLL
ncbi:MAG: primosomal protein N' [Patescibacteria group bacterium]|nr:primosomal protein N' [Patescibacteria group bacterium]